MVTGMDTSAVDLLQEIVEICDEHECGLFLAGTSPNLRSILLYAGVARTRTTSYIGDLETALAKAEDGLLSTVLHREEKAMAEAERRRRNRSESSAEDGFLYALRNIDEQHGLNVAQELKDFQAHTVPVELNQGEFLVRDPIHSGVYFVETGLLRVRHPTSHSTASLTARQFRPTLGTMNIPTLSIGALDARGRTVGSQRAALSDMNAEQTEQRFRLASIGTGWVIGSVEASGGLHSSAIHVAMTTSRLHHLPYQSIQEMETSNPTLSMNLYKLLSLLSTKRQEKTIQQLDQFVKIMNAPIPRLRGGKRELAKLQIS